MSSVFPATSHQPDPPPNSSIEGGGNVPDILIVDDGPDNIRLLNAVLSRYGYHIREAQEGQAAIALALAEPPDLILLDVMLPGLDGYAICRQLRANPDTENIPVIFVSALDATFDKVKAFSVGGADYITKPFQTEELLARVRHQLALQDAQREIQQLNTRLEARVRERTQQLAAANTRLSQLAFRDDLTGLPNRAQFLEYLTLVLLQAERQENYRFVVLCLDCDRFKTINDSLGHLVGDRLLVAIARRLLRQLPRTTLLARLGGDEFGIILLEAGKEAATEVAVGILEDFARPFMLAERQIFTNASIGLVTGDAKRRQGSELLQDADAAMYEAKARGKGRFCWFSPAMRGAALQRLSLETDLRQAIARSEFYLVYQPIVTLATGKVKGFEALVRWQHPQRGLVTPGEFIPLAEETGTIAAIGEWVLQAACHQLRQWQESGFSPSLNVNLSVRQLERPELLASVDSTLADYGIDPTDLGLEITESACLSSTHAVQMLHQLKARYLSISLDDFGTGYSSLSYLHALPIDTLKIDRSFVMQLEARSGQHGLVPAIVSMAQALGLRVVAEGIETIEQLAQLRSLGAGFGQGYFFSRPLAASAATELLERSPQW